MQTIFNERMDTKKLRQKVLDLAIRGKLVPQDPNDEPASVLLERIRAEKERLIKEGKIKRGKMSATDDEFEAPFEIPESWKWVRLEDFVMAVTDGDHQPPPQSPTGVPFLVISDVNTGIIDFSHARSVSEEYYNSLPAIRQAAKGDILFTVTGSYGIPILVETEQKFCFQRHIGLIKTLECSRWISIVLQSNYVLKYCDKVATGTAQKTVSLGHLRDLLIPVPRLAEQQRIANEVERWFAVIDELESNEGDLLKAIDQAKSKILDLAIHGKLVPQDPNDEPAIELLKRINPKFEACEDVPYDIPESWVLCNLGVLYNIVSAKRVHKSDWKHKGIPFYRAREIVKLADEGHVDNVLFISESHYEEMKTKYGVPNPTDIMMSAVGTIGRTYEVKESDIFYYKDASVLCLQNVNSLYSPYICLLLSSQFLQDQMFAHSKGTTVDTITIEKANSYVIPLPPIAEQHRIVAKIEELFAVLDSINESLA